ncbi:MAG: site-2 protease family protein [bacterium]|nr:site-2 protease family protein [bacterium]
MINTLFSNPLLFIVYFAALLIAIAIHEFSHAFVADRLGDPTPGLQGRLTLNPLAHVDNFGMIFLLFFGFGWGKPVQFDPYNLKNPRKDAALISIAGPISNILIAIVLAISLKVFTLFTIPFFSIIGPILYIIIRLNVMLAVFNLLPINPLDGFKIVGGMLSEEKSREWYQLERYGMFFLLALIFPFGGTSMLDMIMNPIITFVLNLLVPIHNTGII